MEEPLRFGPIVEYRRPKLAPLPPYSLLALSIEQALISATGLPVLAKEAVEVYWGLKNLTPIRPAEGERLVGTGQGKVMSEYKVRLEALERRALILSQLKTQDRASSPNSDSDFSSDVLIYRLFGSAALIHVVLFLRDSPSSIPLSWVLSWRMKESLHPDNIRSLMTQFPDMMGWVLLMAGVGSMGAGHAEFCVGLFVQAIARSGFRSAAQLESAMGNFMWFDSYRGEEMVGFWERAAFVKRVTLVDRTRVDAGAR